MSLFTHVQAELELAEFSAEATWHVDVPTHTITFMTAAGTRVFPVQLLGSIAHAAGTWMWGWHEHHAQYFSPSGLQIARRVYDTGCELGIEELTTPVLALHETPSLPLQLAAETIGGVQHTMQVDVGRGISLVLAIAAGSLRQPDMEGLLRIAIRGAELGIVDDHRSALESYARRMGLAFTPVTVDPVRYRLTGPAGGIEFEADDTGRMTALHEIVSVGRLR